MHKIEQSELDGLIKALESFSRPEKTEQKDLDALFRIFTLFYELITEFRHINFTSLFSRMVFAGVQYNLPGELMFESHYFRRSCEESADTSNKEQIYDLGLSSLWKCINKVFGTSIPESIKNITVDMRSSDQTEKRAFTRIIRALLIDLELNDEGKYEISFCSEEEAHKIQKAIVVSEMFARQLLRLQQHVGLNIPVSLVDVNHYDTHNEVSAVVIKPDFLIGVTSISECFQSSGSLAISSLSRKLLPIDTSKYLLMGNVVNYLLDELIHREDLSFDVLLKEVFRISPIEFALMSDNELREFLDKLSVHYLNLRSLIGKELEDLGIERETAFLEPSFYSNEYGIQGRLDMYHYDEGKKQSDIIELKSGKLFRPNSYGLNENHYVQTLLYDLLIESVHKARIKSNNYILYSVLDDKNLRFAPRSRNKQHEALYVRNDIILIEEVLSQTDSSRIDNLLSYLDRDKIPADFNFLIKDAEIFKTVYASLTELEKQYYLNFLGFLSREYALSKTGKHGIFSDNGLAALWLDKLQDKTDKFKILSYLEIRSNMADEENPLIELCYSHRSSLLTRFRVGDIAVLYPDDGAAHSALNHQIFKCTIIGLDQEKVLVRLRARQKNNELFEAFQYWHLEPDVLDSSILKQFHSLFAFAKSTYTYRQQILSLEAPQKYQLNTVYDHPDLSKEQRLIINKAISSIDYFLIWGPPGTGKTSIVIRSLVDHYFNSTGLDILLLAYTNRAVDEICEAIDSVCNKSFIRIGSRYSTSAKYQDKLFSSVSDKTQSRKDLIDQIREHRVFVSTISSYQGMRDLNKIKQFDLVIIDEASQVLEPMLVGILSEFDKFILIGDHKQLPAVVAQTEEESEIRDEGLREQCGLENMANSLFERMYLQCQKNDWNWAFDILTKQGRMHSDILDFVTNEFYNNQLSILDKIDRLQRNAELRSFDRLSELLIHKRMIFVNTPCSDLISMKANELEAELLVKVLRAWLSIYSYNEMTVKDDSFGVITPFRAQIAMIKEKMDEGLREECISIDTVERYQGSSRDRVFISLAVTEANMLDSITKLSNEGVDRKLNVALTRAKENVLIFGNREVLERSPVYTHLLNVCYQLESSELMNLD